MKKGSLVKKSISEWQVIDNPLKDHQINPKNIIPDSGIMELQERLPAAIGLLTEIKTFIEPVSKGGSSAKIMAGDHFNRRHTRKYSED